MSKSLHLQAPSDTLQSSCNYCLDFMDGETEAQKGWLTEATRARRVEGWEVEELGSKLLPAAQSLPLTQCTTLCPCPSEER